MHKKAALYQRAAYAVMLKPTKTKTFLNNQPNQLVNYKQYAKYAHLEIYTMEHVLYRDLVLI